MTTSIKRVALFGEAVTLAHVARPLALGRALDPARYEITFVTDERYRQFAAASGWAMRRVHTIPAKRFLDALATGRPLYDAHTLRGYVDDDLSVLKEIRPDVVVGDFRLSLSISARVAGIPYVAISSAYWSPYARQSFPLPEHPLVELMGLRTAQVVFDLARPFAFAYHALPLNRVRREFKLPWLGLDLQRVYTDADYVAYADLPEMVPTRELPANHTFLGPVLWSPPVEAPHWWRDLPTDRPIVYVTMGSSGAKRALERVVEAVAGLDCIAIVATAGESLRDPLPANVRAADYLRGDDATGRSDLVICNGGSPTSYQALAAGIPVLGVAGNMDQHLNMQGVERAGAGIRLRNDRASVEDLRLAAGRLLDDPSYRRAAMSLSATMQRYDAAAAFARIVDRAAKAG